MDKTLYLKINNKCNMNCSFCADSYRQRKEEDPSFEENKSIILKERITKENLMITGGEPTIYPHFLELVRYSKSIGYKQITVATNGLMFSNKSFLNKSMKSGLTKIQLSYLSNNKNDYESFSRYNNSFELVKKAISNINSLDIPYYSNIVIHKKNITYLKELIDDLLSKNCMRINFAFIHPMKCCTSQSLSYNESNKYLTRIISYIKEKPVTFENIPLCINREIIPFLKDLIYKDDYNKEIRYKPDKCRKCIYFNECQGIHNSYYQRYGSEELRPITFPIQKNRRYDFQKSIYFDHYFEIAGVINSIKKGSIIYFHQKEIDSLINFLNKKKIRYDISNFNYEYINEKTIITDKGYKSIYISKDIDIVKELKKLDYEQQFFREEKTTAKIAKILGYPNCCTRFIQKCVNNQNYHNIKKKDKGLDEESLLRILALRNERNISFLLNNFSISSPRLINYFVCSYRCKDSIKIAKQILYYFKREFPNEYNLIIKDLKIPFLFNSPYRIIYFYKMRKTKFTNVYHYSDCFYKDNLLKDICSKKKDNFITEWKKIKSGNKIKLEKECITIYNHNKPIHLIKKTNDFFGRLIIPE